MQGVLALAVHGCGKLVQWELEGNLSSAFRGFRAFATLGKFRVAGLGRRHFGAMIFCLLDHYFFS